jgi:hypothetical protein
MENRLEQPEDLAELRKAFLQFRENSISEMVRLRIEIEAVHLTALDACHAPLDEERLKSFRLHVNPKRSSYIDELRLKYGLSRSL